jgi:hypothetical protein
MARKKNKQLQEQSIYDKYDLDGDGVVSDEELKMAEEMRRFENEDQKADAQRKMAWFALLGMLLYPAGIFFTSLVGLDKAAELVADIASVYFVSVAAIVAAFFGASALNKK